MNIVTAVFDLNLEALVVNLILLIGSFYNDLLFL